MSDVDKIRERNTYIKTRMWRKNIQVVALAHQQPCLLNNYDCTLCEISIIPGNLTKRVKITTAPISL
jgi:hypothetical protein